MKKSTKKKVVPNHFPLRLYELKKPVQALAEKKGISINDVIILLLRSGLEASPA